MSWNAYLEDDRGHTDGEWNFTHNCNPMANLALRNANPQRSLMDAISWWRLLNGMSGPDGAKLLDTIISQMESDPETYEKMNPPNQWGSYANLLDILKDMRGAVPEWPTQWEVHG